MLARIRHALPFLSALLFAACGGGGGGSAPPAGGGIATDFWLIALSDRAVDGHVQDDGVFSTTGSCGFVGDIDTPRTAVGSMQFFSFDLSSIPSNAIIDAARLTVHQERVIGNPYTSHGSVVVDQVDLGPALQASDYWLVPVASDIGVISWDATREVKSVDVASAVRRSVSSGWSRAAFRLRWSAGSNSNRDGNVDLAMFNDADDSCGTGNMPTLSVTYRLP